MGGGGGAAAAAAADTLHRLLLVVGSEVPNFLIHARPGCISYKVHREPLLGTCYVMQAVSTTHCGRFDHVISLISDIERVK